MARLPFDLNKVDCPLAYLGVLLSLFIVGYGLLGNHVYIIVGLIMIGAFVLWLLFGDNIRLGTESYSSKRMFLVITSLFFILFTISIMAIQLRPDEYQMPMGYFVLISIMAGLLFMGSLICPKGFKSFLLLEIIMLGLNFVISESTLYPSVLGVDSWWHQWFVNMILTTGNIPLNTIYSNMPLFEVLIAQLSLTSRLDYKTASMIIGGIVIVASALIVYILANRMLGSWRIGLIGALTVVTAESVIRMSYWPIPTSIAGIMMLIVIFLVFTESIRRTFAGTSLIIFFMLALIITHSITALAMGIVLTVAYLSFVLFNYQSTSKGRFISYSVPSLFIAAMFAWWAYASTQYFHSFSDFHQTRFWVRFEPGDIFTIDRDSAYRIARR